MEKRLLKVDQILNRYPNNWTHFRAFDLDKSAYIDVTGKFEIISNNLIIEASGNINANKEYFEVTSYTIPLSKNPKTHFIFLNFLNLKGVGKKTIERILEDHPDFFNNCESFLSNPKEYPINHLNNEQSYELFFRLKKIDIRTYSIGIDLFGDFIVSKLGLKTLLPYIKSKKLKEIIDNPFLLEKHKGIGVKKCISLADSLNIPGDSPVRLRAYIVHILKKNESYGHTYIEEMALVGFLINDFGINDTRKVKNILAQMSLERIIYFDDDLRIISLFSTYKKECFIAENIKDRCSKRESRHQRLSLSLMADDFTKDLSLEVEQIKTIKSSVISPITIIRGEPGTGKTTTLKYLCDLLEKNNFSYHCCALSTKACEVLSHALKRPKKVSTIHKTFKVGISNLWKAREFKLDFLIIDETSMIDLNLIEMILKKTDMKTKIIFLGDDGQLSNIGGGNFFKDLQSFSLINTQTLKVNHRQVAKSSVPKLSHYISRGRIPSRDLLNSNDIELIENDSNEEIFLSTINRFLKFQRDNQECIIIVPGKRGELGSVSLNKKLNFLINEDEEKIYEGTPVIAKSHIEEFQIVRSQIFKVESIGKTYFTLCSGRSKYKLPVDYLGSFSLAYAITTNKSQGSQFSNVIIPLSVSQYALASKKSFKTSATRSREHLCLIGNYKAIYMYLNTSKDAKRDTLLPFLLGDKIIPNHDDLIANERIYAGFKYSSKGQGILI
ncbi:MAG: AAA family ATPase [Oligoflexia bacterium]|nr:AAA family ATPase [Oligoflexia bacterium]